MIFGIVLGKTLKNSVSKEKEHEFFVKETDNSIKYSIVKKNSDDGEIRIKLDDQNEILIQTSSYRNNIKIKKSNHDDRFIITKFKNDGSVYIEKVKKNNDSFFI